MTLCPMSANCATFSLVACCLVCFSASATAIAETSRLSRMNRASSSTSESGNDEASSSRSEGVSSYALGWTVTPFDLARSRATRSDTSPTTACLRISDPLTVVMPCCLAALAVNVQLAAAVRSSVSIEIVRPSTTAAAPGWTVPQAASERPAIARTTPRVRVSMVTD
jgi:hypothetical protein